MASASSPASRALQGLKDGSGQTLVVAGPPLSGKSEFLNDVKARAKDLGFRVLELKGTYRNRAVAYAPLGALLSSAILSAEAARERDSAPPEEERLDLSAPPIPAVGYLSEPTPGLRRARGSRGRSTYLGRPVRGRPALQVSFEQHWEDLVRGFRKGDRPIVYVLEDAAYFDDESREFIVQLAQRARLRPVLVVAALDSSVPGFMGWEDRLVGRTDVDWVRFNQAKPDSRELNRLRPMFDDLPAITQRVVGYVALLGGTAGEVVLSRIARLTFPKLGEALLPAANTNLVRVQNGKVSLVRSTWAGLLPSLLTDRARKEMHLEIAEALSALSPEPGLERRGEIAHHYYSWYPGPMALRYLLESAELSLHLQAHDLAEEFLTTALTCVSSLPVEERPASESELRILHALSLFYAGRPEEAVLELREGFALALQSDTAREHLEEWLEPLVLAFRVVGPRTSLRAELGDLSDRCHDTGLVQIEVLLQSVIVEFELERGLPGKARIESHRAAKIAQKLGEGPVRALALLAVGLSRIEGSNEEQALAEKFLRAAKTMLGQWRRYELEQLAEELRARLHRLRGEVQDALVVHERSVSNLHRMRLLPIELYHQLGIAEIGLNRTSRRGVEPALRRAREISELLHLTPPSPGVLRLWLLEGRHHAVDDAIAAARDRWESIVDLPSHLSIPRIRAEAIARLSLLETVQGRDREAEGYVDLLRNGNLASVVPPAWKDWTADVARVASSSENGGGPLAGEVAAIGW